MTMRIRRAAWQAALLVSVPVVGACGSSAPAASGSAGAPRPQGAAAASDTTGRNLVPPGYGSLRQDDIAIKTQLQSTLVRVLPLDEAVIRLLSPDSYRALRELKDGKRAQIASLAERHNVREPSLWYVSYYGLQPESRFSATDVVINSAGREYRPLEFIPLSAGFRDQKVRQRETQSAIYLYEDGPNPDQALAVTVEGVPNAAWESILRTVERERAAIRSRVPK
ncbi:MAG: hypothetical protein ABJD07_04260 [Gemmatimonadaceae bacterium]